MMSDELRAAIEREIEAAPYPMVLAIAISDLVFTTAHRVEDSVPFDYERDAGPGMDEARLSEPT